MTRQKISQDGKSWSDGVTHRVKPAYGNGIWVSHVGNYLCSSFDGLNWTNQYYTFSSYEPCLIYGNGFIFKSGSTILKSANGTSWNSQSLISNRYFRNFIYYRNKYICRIMLVLCVQMGVVYRYATIHCYCPRCRCDIYLLSFCKETDTKRV